MIRSGRPPRSTWPSHEQSLAGGLPVATPGAARRTRAQPDHLFRVREFREEDEERAQKAEVAAAKRYHELHSRASTASTQHASSFARLPPLSFHVVRAEHDQQAVGAKRRRASRRRGQGPAAACWRKARRSTAAWNSWMRSS
eukprot:7389373-Prymnesium_polylepis.4